ncbi:MAG: hypothetical protein HYT70_03510 [Candidatus Aenigmarchaeota archaeon]|nr:hypothetical protein [Candidatus Aenigmarchaeota archaeon]
MNQFRTQLNEASKVLFGEGNVRESDVDTILRVTLGSTYKPEEGQVIARVIRNHRAPYIVKTVDDGTTVYAYPGNIRGILEGDFVPIKLFGEKTNGVPYGMIIRAYDDK